MEPVTRFLEVAWVGAVVGVTLVLVGAPGGLLFVAVSQLWRAKPSDGVEVAGSLAQVSLTVWALVVAIGGATYVEAARTIRSDARERARALNAGRHFVQSGASPGFDTGLPPELRGQLMEIALDTPRLEPRRLRSVEALEALALDFDAVQDYWNCRSGYSADVNNDWAIGDAKKAVVKAQSTWRWRIFGLLLVLVAAVAYWQLGSGNLVAPIALVLACACVYVARAQLLGRSWRQ